MAKHLPQTVIRNSFKGWAFCLGLASLILIIFTTLYPFNFSWQSITEAPLLSHFYLGLSGKGLAKELLRNLILFIPLGFSTANLLKYQGLRRWPNGIAAVVILLVLSAFIELLQVFLPGRTATLSDILARSFGGLFGTVCFYIWRRKIAHFIEVIVSWFWTNFSARNLYYFCLSYIALFAVFSASLQANTHLGNWDTDVPLIIGNEATGDRPWRGYVSEIAIAADPLSSDTLNTILQKQDFSSLDSGLEFIAHYRFSDTGNTQYPDDSGHLPALQWYPTDPKQASPPAVQLGPENWLKVDDVSSMIQHLRNTSTFTLLATIATNDRQQRGPARIISLSDGPYSRNLTLGQEETDLILRLRTPVTGNNGSSPDIAVPDFFSDLDFHTVAITYGKGTVYIYTDTTKHPYSIHFTPDITGFQYLLPLGTWTIRAGQSTLGYKATYYSLALAPITLALLLYYTTRARQRQHP